MQKVNSIFLFCSGVFLFFAALILVIEFFPACEQGSGNRLICQFGTGMVAKIEGPATIHIFDDEKFTVGYNSNGVLSEQSSVKTSIFHEISFQTSESIDLYMLESTYGSLLPLIRVDANDGQQYPSLTVSRTIKHPLTQLFQWFLFPAMIGPLIFGILFLVFSFDFSKKH